jgi:hypothetical protein
VKERKPTKLAANLHIISQEFPKSIFSIDRKIKLASQFEISMANQKAIENV